MAVDANAKAVTSGHHEPGRDQHAEPSPEPSGSWTEPPRRTQGSASRMSR